MLVGAVPRTVNRSLWACAADKRRETDGGGAPFPNSPLKYRRCSPIPGQCWTKRCDMDDNENYYYCYDYYYDDVGDDGSDFRADFPGGRCWEPVTEPVVLQDSTGQVADGGLPAVADRRGTRYLCYYCIFVSQSTRVSRRWVSVRNSDLQISKLNVKCILTTINLGTTKLG